MKNTLRGLWTFRITPYILLGVGLLLIGISIFIWLRKPVAGHHRLGITAGSAEETRERVAEYLARESASRDVTVRVEATRGSIEALQKVESREIDLALVDGIIRLPAESAVRQVAQIYSEPMHLLVKEELEERIGKDLRALVGTTINVGQPGSATHLLALEVLEFMGLEPTGGDEKEGVILKTLGHGEILAQVQALAKAGGVTRRELYDQLPDAFFVIATLPSRVAHRLVSVAGYRLVPLPFARAFSLIEIGDEAGDSQRIDQLHIKTMEIPEFTYGVIPPVPPAPCPTLGMPLLLVAHRDVPAEAVRRILSLIYQGPVEHLYRPPPIDGMAAVYPLHEGTIAYRDRDRPFVRADVMDTLQRLASFVGPLLGGLLALYGYYRWRQLLRFDEYFRRLIGLAQNAQGLRAEKAVPDFDHRRRYLEQELDEIQRAAVADFCSNYFYREGVLVSLMALVGEIRRGLPAQAPSSPPSE